VRLVLALALSASALVPAAAGAKPAPVACNVFTDAPDDVHPYGTPVAVPDKATDLLSMDIVVGRKTVAVVVRNAGPKDQHEVQWSLTFKINAAGNPMNFYVTAGRAKAGVNGGEKVATLVRDGSVMRVTAPLASFGPKGPKIGAMLTDFSFRQRDVYTAADIGVPGQLVDSADWFQKVKAGSPSCVKTS
jgi:hypothetical protein